MSTPTFNPDSSVLTLRAGDRPKADLLRNLGAGLARGREALGPYGRRFLVTGVGAVLALGLGAVTASAVRLPPEIRDPAQAQDQGLVQDEPSSITTARANALANPPALILANQPAMDPQASEAAAVPAAAAAAAAAAADTDATTQDDDQPATVAYTTPTPDAADDDAAPAVSRAAPAAPPSSDDQN